MIHIDIASDRYAEALLQLLEALRRGGDRPEILIGLNGEPIAEIWEEQPCGG